MSQDDIIDDAIVVPRAQDRVMELIQREQLPDDVRGVLSGALLGDLPRQQLLFEAMIDTWPRLQKCLAEIRRAARCAQWKIEPWTELDAKPTPAAEQFSREIHAAIWGMKPDMVRNLKGFEGTVEQLADAYFMGHSVLEIHWKRTPKGILPQNTKIVPPRFYGYETTASGHLEDYLRFNRSGGWTYSEWEDFPDNRFLVAINQGHAGHPAIAAPLRALCNYWIAAVFGLKWFMGFAQLFGIPFRWAEYTDEQAKTKVMQMMARIGAAGYGAFPAGTKINIEKMAGSGGSQLPQKILLELADEQCTQFILGQTLTSGTDTNGNRALGEVHDGVRQDVIRGVCDFIGEVLTHQLIPAIATLNGKPTEQLPGIWAKFEDKKDEAAIAARYKTIVTEIGLPVTKAHLYDTLGVPIPADGEEIFAPPARPQTPPTLQPVIAANAEQGTEAIITPEQLFQRMNQALAKGNMLDWRKLAILLGASFTQGVNDKMTEIDV